MKKTLLLLMVALFLFPLSAEEGITLVEDPSLLEEVYQEFSLRIIQSLKDQDGSILVGYLTSNGYPLNASVMFQSVVLKELLVSMPEKEIYEIGSFRGEESSMGYLIGGETYQEQDVIFISLRMIDNQSGRVLAIQNFTIPANARWGSSFLYTATPGGGTVDRLEPNDSITAARQVDFPVVNLSAGFHSSEDWDYYKILIPEGTEETFVTAETSGSTDTVMTIYGPDDMYSTYGEDDDSGSDYNAKIGFPVLGGQTWWIAVHAYDSEGPYTLNVTASAEGSSQDEENVSFSTAFPMVLDEPLVGYYSYNDSGDYFTLQVDENMLGSLLRIYTDDRIDTELYLYDESRLNGEEALYYNDDTDTYAAAITFVPVSTGIYYIKLTAYDEGPYAITAEKMDVPVDPSEPNDSFDSASHIELGQPQTQSFFHEMDMDYFVFEADELRRYNIETTGYIDPYITIYDGNREYLDSDDDSGQDTNAMMRIYLEPGTYYLELKSAVSDGMGDYTLLVE